MSAEARLKQLGITLPNVPAPVANYLPYRVAGNLLFLAGQGPRDANGNLHDGQGRRRRFGRRGLQARPHHRAAAPVRDPHGARLARPRRHGPQDAVHGQRRAGLQGSPKVANGMSDLFVEVFGDAGKHARSAVGMGSLPGQISVEIEGIFSIKIVSRKAHRRLIRRCPRSRCCDTGIVASHAVPARDARACPSLRPSVDKSVHKNCTGCALNCALLLVSDAYATIADRLCGGRRFCDGYPAISPRIASSRSSVARAGRTPPRAFHRSFPHRPLEALLHQRAILGSVARRDRGC